MVLRANPCQNRALRIRRPGPNVSLERDRIARVEEELAFIVISPELRVGPGVETTRRDRTELPVGGEQETRLR